MAVKDKYRVVIPGSQYIDVDMTPCLGADVRIRGRVTASVADKVVALLQECGAEIRKPARTSYWEGL